MPTPVKVHATATTGTRDTLQAGKDVVLRVTDGSAASMPIGLVADDLLDDAARIEADQLAQGLLRSWVEATRDPLTVDGLSLPWAWELELLTEVAIPLAADVVALRRAGSEVTGVGVAAAVVAAALGDRDGALDAADGAEARAWSAQRTGLRQRLVGAARGHGIPTTLRRESVLIASYWPLLPLFDRMLDLGRRVAVPAGSPPEGLARSLRAARSGGLLGTPSRAVIARAACRVETLVADLPAPPEDAVEALFHRRAMRLARRRGGADVSAAALAATAFARRPPAAIVLPNDVVADTRLLLHAGAGAGSRVLAVQHGVYLAGPPAEGEVDERVGDLDSAPEVAVWSKVAAEALERTHGVHVVGYPLGGAPAPARIPDRRRPRILVLVQVPEPITNTISLRNDVVHTAAALAAAAMAAPGAHVTVRPHPSSPPGPVEAVVARAGLDANVDRTSSIDVLLATHDLCVGARSTATYQAALAGLPVLILNTSAVEWKYPLGRGTAVRVARDADGLAADLAETITAGAAPGRELLLDALGASRNGTDALLELLA